ncbi:MAG: tetratricopeptide repeat protein [Puia sp.]
MEEGKRNYQAAILLYSKVIDLAPEKKDMYEARIKELNTRFRILVDLEEKYNAGYYKEAVKGYSALLKKPELNTDYSNSDYYLGRAKCFDRMGQLTRSYNEQIENYNKALKDYATSYGYDNNNIETIRLRADLYRRMNRNPEALTEYRIYLAKDSTDLSVYEAMANLHMLSGDPDQAIKDIDLALSQRNIDPVSKSKLIIEKGVLYAQKMDYSSAEDYFTRAIGNG